MFFKLKKTSFLILAITALVCSRATFSFFKDPEGPNLLIGIVLATALYLVSLMAYVFDRSDAIFRKLLIAICIQIAAVTCLSFFLR